MANGPPELGDTSSKRSNTTVFGSCCVLVRLNEDVRPARLPCDCTLIRLLLGDAVAEYSGRSEKLSGVTTTPKVPGLCVSAFRSRSSSVWSAANAGISSYLVMGLLLGDDRTCAMEVVRRASDLLDSILLTIPHRVSLCCDIRVLRLSVRGSIAELDRGISGESNAPCRMLLTFHLWSQSHSRFNLVHGCRIVNC